MTRENTITRVVNRPSPTTPHSVLDYWRSRPITERLSTLLQIRADYHGLNDETEQRLERVFARIECR